MSKITVFVMCFEQLLLLAAFIIMLIIGLDSLHVLLYFIPLFMLVILSALLCFIVDKIEENLKED